MGMLARLTHFETFARIRDAHGADSSALWRLSEKLPGGLGGERPIWQSLLQAGDAHVLVAMEGQQLVGATVVWHQKGAAKARLAWLGVCASARRRGVGRLLVESAAARVAVAGAIAMVAHLPSEAVDLERFLAEVGFAEEKGGELKRDLRAR
jgi:GNAT superfamily N-acetyltransferase